MEFDRKLYWANQVTLATDKIKIRNSAFIEFLNDFEYDKTFEQLKFQPIMCKVEILIEKPGNPITTSRGIMNVTNNFFQNLDIDTISDINIIIELIKFWYFIYYKNQYVVKILEITDTSGKIIWKS